MEILIKNEIALHQFEIRKNKKEVARLIHPNFREIGMSGISYDFTGIIEIMDEEIQSNGYIHSQDFESIQIEPSIYLLLYKSAWIDEDGVKSNFAKRSSIWAFSKENWQLKYHQGTPCEEFSISI